MAFCIAGIFITFTPTALYVFRKAVLHMSVKCIVFSPILLYGQRNNNNVILPACQTRESDKKMRVAQKSLDKKVCFIYTLSWFSVQTILFFVVLSAEKLEILIQEVFCQ